MPQASTSNRSRRLARLLLTTSLALLIPSPATLAQGWQRVVQRNDAAGTAIGGGAGNTLYAGLGSGHVFRSDDNGLTWNAVTNGLVDAAGGLLPAKAFVVTPTGRVLRGGDNASWNNKVGSPVFRTDNQGADWTEVPLPFNSTPRNPAGIGVSDLAVHKGALYFSDVLSEAVWRSDDNGASWSSVGSQLPSPPFVGIAKTYYALADAGSALLTVQAHQGVFRTTDGGANWSQAVNGISGVPDSILVGGRSWNGSDVVARPDGTAFAVVDGITYRSLDAGASWTPIGFTVIRSPNPFVPSVIQASARKVEIAGNRVYVATSDSNPRFFEGELAGDSWVELPQIADNADNGSLLRQSFYAHNGALYFAGSKGVHRLDLATAPRTPLAPVVQAPPTRPYGVNVGSPLQATVSVGGTAPFTYEWRIGGQPLPGQTASLLDWTPSSQSQEGELSVVVRNAAGSATATLGFVSISTKAPGSIDYSFQPVVNSGGISLAVSSFAFDLDGSVWVGRSAAPATDGTPSVHRVRFDGTPDPSFLGGAGPSSSLGPVEALLPMGDGTVLVGAAATGDNARYYRRLLANGGLDRDWPWPAEMAGGPRKIVRLADGRFLIAGGSLGGIHRLNADGTFDPTFKGPSSIGTFQRHHVRDFALLPDGRVLIAGAFNSVDGETRVGLARLLANGALDRSWSPGTMLQGSEVNAVALLPDGDILVGGAFTGIGGINRRNLARLNADGTADPALPDLIPSSPTGGIVNAFAVQPDGKVWVGGAFQFVSGRNYLFRLRTDSTVDTDFPDVGFSPAVGGEVRDLALTADGRLWIASGVAFLANRPAGQLFRIFTDRDGPTVGYAGLDQSPVSGTPLTLRATVTGPYSGLQWRFNGTALSGATSPELPLGAATTSLDGLYDLVVTSANGSHTSAPARVRVRGPVVIDSQPAPVVAVISNTAAFSVTAFGIPPFRYQWMREGLALPSGTNRTLLVSNVTAAVSGDYSVRVTAADSSTADSAPAFLTVVPRPGSTNASFALGLRRSTSPSRIQDVAFLPDGRALVAGVFSTTTNGAPNAMLARVLPNGAVDPAFRFDTTGILEVLAIERHADGSILALARLSSGSAPYVVRRLSEDGTADPGFVSPDILFGSDLRIAPDGGILVVSQNGLTRLKPDGTADAVFNQRARLNGPGQSVSIDPTGRIYVTGNFSTVGGQPRAQLARLLPDGTLDTGFAPTNQFTSQWQVTALPDGAWVGDFNGFHRFDDTGRPVREFAWGSRLVTWDRDPVGNLVGVLPTTAGDAVIRDGAGQAALPFSTLKIPVSFNSYTFLRVSPDGSYWLALGAPGSPIDPAALLYRLNGTVHPLAILNHPASRRAAIGERVELMVEATGTSRLRYQWRRNGQPLDNQTNATLVLPAFSANLAGGYDVVVRNDAGIVTSQLAQLVAYLPPRIVSEPASRVVSPKEQATFSVAADGFDLAYQWRAGGTNLPGATAPTLVLPSASDALAGAYSVVVSNAAGSVTSREALLRVRPAPSLGTGTGPLDGLTTRLRFENSFANEVGELVPTFSGNPAFVTGTEGSQAVTLRTGLDWIRIGTGPQRMADDRYTVSFWIKPETSGSMNIYSMILLIPGTTPGTFVSREHFLYLGGNDNNTLGNRIFLGTRGLTSVHSTDNRAYVPNLVGKWTHFAIVYRGGGPSNPANFSVHVNGEPLALTESNNTVGGTASLVNALGRYNVGAQARFQLDDFRAYNRPLDNAEVKSFTTPPVVDPAPVITAQPAGGTVPAGQPFTFTVAATGPNLFYEWFRGNTPLPDITGPTLALAATSPADAGEYRVTLSNSGGSTNSQTATLVVSAPADPFITWLADLTLTGPDASPDADTDADGFNTLAEFAYGTSPKSGADQPAFEIVTESVGGVSHPAVRFLRRSQLAPTRIEVQAAADIGFSTVLGTTEVSATPAGNGLERVVIRSNAPESAHDAQFFRLTVTR